MLHKQSEQVWALQHAVLELEQGWMRGSVPPQAQLQPVLLASEQAPPFVPVQAVRQAAGLPPQQESERLQEPQQPVLAQSRRLQGQSAPQLGQQPPALAEETPRQLALPGPWDCWQPQAQAPTQSVQTW